MATISNVNGKKITKIKYKGEIFDTGGGTDWLKEYLDETKDASGLFCGYAGIGETTRANHLTYEILQNVLKYDTTSSVTKMYGMFYYCRALTSTPTINTNLVTAMGSMFAYCYNLTTIDITHMCSLENNYFARNCYSLTKLIIRNMPTIPALSSSAFNNCYHFTGTTDADYNPQGLKDGRIYVPDDKVDALKTTKNWSKYADIIVPLSTLQE